MLFVVVLLLRYKIYMQLKNYLLEITMYDSVSLKNLLIKMLE